MRVHWVRVVQPNHGISNDFVVCLPDRCVLWVFYECVYVWYALFVRFFFVCCSYNWSTGYSLLPLISAIWHFPFIWNALFVSFCFFPFSPQLGFIVQFGLFLLCFCFVVKAICVFETSTTTKIKKKNTQNNQSKAKSKES